MTDVSPAAEADPGDLEEQAAPACVMSFNVNDPSGAGGSAGDVATIAAMGAHALPIITSIVMRDTAEVFDHHAIDADVIVEQARSVLEDVTIAAWKVGFLGSTEGVSAVAEILSDYPDVPLVAYLPNLAWVEEDEQQAYLEAFRDLVLPQTEVLVGSHQTLADFLLPEWEGERPPSSRELAVAANKHGARYVLVTSIPLPDQFLDNVLASPQGAITGEKFERFETTFVGAGETLSAALAALLATGVELHAAVGEALAFLDQALDAGFRPGMGNVVPDRFFWALARRRRGRRRAGDDAAAQRPTPKRRRAEESAPRPLTRRRRAHATMTNDELFERARRVIPGGVNSPVRAFRAVGGTPRFIVRGDGAVHLRRRRQALPRLHRLVGADDPRPPPPGGAGGGARGGRRRPLVRRADRARGRARRGDPRARAEHGAGAPGQLGHRSGDERAAPGARRDRAQRDRQVRGLLPRPRRRAARQGRLGPGDLRPSDQRRRAGGGRAATRWSSNTTTSPALDEAFARHGADDRLRDDRADRRQHELRARDACRSCSGCASSAARTARCSSSTR